VQYVINVVNNVHSNDVDVVNKCPQYFLNVVSNAHSNDVDMVNGTNNTA
jgi:hypothetical protein